ncbi:MAG: hypothetical protein AB7O70_12860, partial [Hyphomicrobiales bacterium]
MLTGPMTTAAPRIPASTKEWRRFKYPQSLYRYFGLLAALSFIVWSIVYLEIPLERFIGMFGRVGDLLANRYYPPDME